MRKILCVVLALLLMAAILPAALAEEAWIDIDSPEELAAIGKNPGANYRLTADLDMTGVDWIPIPLSGRFDGNGHGIYNLSVRQPGAEKRMTYDGNLKEYETVFAGLFSTVEGGSVSNLHLLGVDIRIDTPTHCFAAGIAGYLNNAVVENCSVFGKVWMDGNHVMVGVGGIAGFGCGEIKSCTVQAELVFTDYSTGTRCEEFMGGVLACGMGNISDCKVAVDGYDSCHGYVHNGGLVGMFYHCSLGYTGKTIRDCEVTGRIRFFENNPDRRAYCAAFVGESLTIPALSGNSQDFLRDETKDYSVNLFPETCASPTPESRRIVPSCQSWGYTEYQCTTCGYRYRDTYMPPRHQPGEAVVERAPTYDTPGLSKQYCTVCGEVVTAQELAKLVRSQDCALSADTLKLNYRSSYRLTATLSPEDAAEKGVQWSSSDESVVRVDENGNLYAAGRGTAVITCRAADGGAEASCTVSVGYSFGQWLIVIFLFGWIWY